MAYFPNPLDKYGPQDIYREVSLVAQSVAQVEDSVKRLANKPLSPTPIRKALTALSGQVGVLSSAPAPGGAYPFDGDGNLVLHPKAGKEIALGVVSSGTFAAKMKITASGVALSSFTSGSVIFAGASGVLSENATNFSWDPTNKTLNLRRDQNATSFLGNFQNANTSTAASTQVNIGQDGSTGKNLALNYLGSGYATSGTNIASSASIRAEIGATGGLVIRTDANAPIIMATGGSAAANERVRIHTNGISTDGGASYFKYEPYSFTGYLGGMTSTVSGTLEAIKIGNTVLLKFPEMLGTSGFDFLDMGTLPAELRPSAQRRITTAVVDDSSEKPALAIIGSDGVITFYLYDGTTYMGTGFTPTGVKGVGTGLILPYHL